MSAQFDWRRIVHLARRDLIGSYRIALVAAAAVIALLIVQALVTQPFTTDRTTVYLGAVWILCFVVGPIVASRAFAELHDKERNVAYLMLPASAVEKVAVRAAIVTVLFFIASTVVVTASAWLILPLKALAFGTVETPFLPAAVFDYNYLGLFVAQQSVFLLGAAWFRRQHFVKTGLALSVLMLATVWLAMLTVRLTWPGLGEMLVANQFNPAPLLIRLADAYASVGWLAGLVVYVVLPVFCWTVAWLRLREAQVSHGV
jgi:hypothetical protein